MSIQDLNDQQIRNLSVNLQNEADRRGLTIKQLSRRARVSEATLRLLLVEQDATPMTAQQLVRLCVFFQIPPGELFHTPAQE